MSLENFANFGALVFREPPSVPELLRDTAECLEVQEEIVSFLGGYDWRQCFPTTEAMIEVNCLTGLV